MSRTSTLGNIGESGPVQFINQWFPDAEHGGLGARRIPSKGSNDIGDIDGVPYTAIECKNYSNPPLSQLLDNAKWKGGNSGRPIWCLVYKRKGYGMTRVGFWHTCMTAEGFLSGFMPSIENPVTGLLDPAYNFENLELLCNESIDLDVELGARFPRLELPELRWTVRLMFRPYKAKIEEKRNHDIDSFGLSESDRIVPVVIHPRVSRGPQEWYVYTRLAGMMRMLETVGIAPQDMNDYVTEPEADPV